MTRPAVVIGLGGTGQWILTYLKKDLLEANGGVMPANVRLLAFDTVSQAEAQKQVVGGLYSGEQAAYERQAKRIGTIELERDAELVHIGGDCYPLAKEIQEGRHPHLSWFDVDYWMKKAGLARDNWILDRGAGRFRQFGLLAVYKDLLGGTVNSHILRRLPTAINEVLETVEGDSSFEIIVIGSVAGGTGSAMLVPFGVLARKMCGENVPVRTRSIVVLPSAFSPGRPSAELELRGGAALRELARAMMPPEGYSAKVRFLPGHREFESVDYTRPFDGIYFIDGVRDTKPINNDPKYGVFPAAASWVRQILDDQSGMWFTNYVATNRAGAQAGDPQRLAEGVFGVFGVYSLFTPERSLRQSYRLKLSNEVLRELTDPKPLGPGSRLAPNPLPRGVPEPSQVALEFLRETAVYESEQQPTTSLWNEVARIVAAGGAASSDEINRRAQAGWAALRRAEREADSWLSPVISLPAGARYDSLNQDVDLELRAAFYQRFVPSDAAKPPRDPGSQQTFVDLTSNVQEYLRQHYGGMGADGPDDYGSFGEIAARCAAEQVNIMRTVLRLRLLALLSENNRRGRIGYAIRITEALEKHLDSFDAFMDSVDKARNKLAPRVELENKVQAAENRWLRDRKEQPSLSEKVQRKPSQKAIKSEKAYLAARYNLLDYVREEVLHRSVQGSVKALRSYCTETRRELERWATMLLEGDTALDIRGLLTEAQADLDRITTTIREDQRSSDVEKLVQVASREGQIDPSDIAWALEGVRWESLDSADSLRFSLNMRPQGVIGGMLQVPREGLSAAERRRLETQNKQLLGRVLEQRFGQVEHVSTVLKWCQDDEIYADAAKLAAELVDGSKPLTSLRPSAQPGMEAFSISVNREIDPTGYAEQLEQAARIKLTGGTKWDNNQPVNVIGSDDPYRLTAVRTQVGLMLEEFDAWDKVQKAYETELGKVEKAETSAERIKELTQTLQSQYTQREEKEAVALEVKWRSEGLAHRVLSPRMVSLVGKPRELQAALQCWALGWVREAPDKQFPDRYHWEIVVPGWEYDVWLTPNKEGKGAVGPFEALEAFVLVGRNKARGREGAPLDMVGLYKAFQAQRQAPEGGGTSPMRTAIERALDEGGVIAEWEAMAGPYVDPNTDRETYRNPAYHDLADYAKRYFESAEW